MDVVIDANVLAAFYKASVHEETDECSDQVLELFDRLGNQDLAFVDSGQMIETEWRAQADPDWFDAWFVERITEGAVSSIDVDSCGDLVKKLETKCGFPKGSRDRWYVRTARTRVITADGEVALVSKDVDLFHPKAKGNSGARRKALRHCSGCVVKELGRCSIHVRTPSRHVS